LLIAHEQKKVIGVLRQQLAENDTILLIALFAGERVFIEPLECPARFGASFADGLRLCRD